MKKNNSLLTVNVTLLTLGFFTYVLYIGASIIIPFVVAVLLSFIIISIAGFFHKKGLPKVFSMIGSLIFIGFIFFGIWKIIDVNIVEIRAGAPAYQERLTNIIVSFSEKYSIDSSTLTEQMKDTITIGKLLSTTAVVIAAIVKNGGMIIFFTLFILLESKSFINKLLLITGGRQSSFFKIFEQIQEDIKSYFMIKTIASLTVGCISAIIMFFFGIDFFIFWAFIIFLLNYIPSVGSIVAVFFPVIFSLIQFESFYVTTIFLILMVSAQVLIGNMVEPRLLGNKLNLSPLVILIALIFWGTLWGPIGMLLCVPIMAIINIVLAHIEITRPIAILLSEKGIIKIQGMKEISNGKFSIKKLRKKLLNK